MTTANISYAELNAVLDQARTHTAAQTPVSEAQLLGLQYRWITALSARLDNAIELSGAKPLTDSVAEAWRELSAERETLRAVLDHYETSSDALASAMRREFRVLALAAGLAGLDDPVEESVRIGRGLRDLIRTGHTELAGELVKAA